MFYLIKTITFQRDCIRNRISPRSVSLDVQRKPEYHDLMISFFPEHWLNPGKLCFITFVSALHYQTNVQRAVFSSLYVSKALLNRHKMFVSTFLVKLSSYS